eukprot:a180040_41.p1 GENE.a180040_41~~a180040_41.p1  ORF type:complete len:435 (-),score=182.52 a180040_41:20-1294(-)
MRGGSSQQVVPINENSPLLPTAAKAAADTATQQPFGAFMTLTTAFIGGGLLALPYACKKAGLYASIFGIVFFAFIGCYTLHLLAAIAKRMQGQEVTSIADVGMRLYGNFGSRFSTFMMVMTQVGFAASYVLFLSQNLHSLMPQLTAVEWVGAVSPILIGMSWLRSLKFLAPSSSFAVVTVLSAVIVVLVNGFKHEGVKPLHTYDKVNIEGLPIFWGVAAFGYCVHNLVLPMYRVSATPQHFGKVINLSIFAVMLLYGTFGICGYLFFGKATESVITLNLDPKSAVVKIVKGALCLVLFCTFPIQLFPVTTLVERFLLGNRVSKSTYWLEQNVVRALEVVLIASIAIAIPLFGLFSSLIGAFSVSCIMLILPCVFYLKMFWDELSTLSIAFCIFVLVLGVFGSIISTIADSLDIINALRTGSNGN